MPKYRFLLAEDSPTVRRGLKQAMEKYGAEVVAVENGEEAYQRALAEPFDLIVTDVDMPIKDGLSLCKDIKLAPATKAVPVMMVSTFIADEDIAKGFEAGAAAYISKADILSELHDKINKVLSSSAFRKDHTILLVEDTNIIRKKISYELLKAGYKVETAEDGVVGLQQLMNNKIDLILSDIDMPEMDGFEFCSAVKADATFHSIPFVVMSAHGERSHMKRMVELGAATYLVKPFNPEEMIILIDRLLSDQFQILLHERERLEHERATMLSSITSLVHALEARDAYTRGHSESVADIVAEMVAMTGADEAEVELVRIGGRLHDIGKIGVKDNVLLKPGKLTDSEFAHIKAHPVIGANILESIESLREVIPICLHHHERFDGRGYPHGLKGMEIPLWSRMTAVADTYNAMTSDRPYRKGMPDEKALKIIKEVSGSQLCPDSVRLFLKWHALKH